MAYNSAKFVLNEYLCVIKLQLLIGFLCVIIALLLSKNLLVLFSALYGFGIGIIPTIVYVKTVWSKKVLNGEQIFARHKKAELFKFLITIFAFASVFIYLKDVHVLALFTTYVATLSSYWISLFIKVKSRN